MIPSLDEGDGYIDGMKLVGRVIVLSASLGDAGGGAQVP